LAHFAGEINTLGQDQEVSGSSVFACFHPDEVMSLVAQFKLGEFIREMWWLKELFKIWSQEQHVISESSRR
jgi:hypothetical protein